MSAPPCPSQKAQPQYVGRFAPSPTGPLHMGSLVAALASYLDAHANRGEWLVRIEDLDPPRNIAGASDDILRCLDAHGLHWQATVQYQSQQLAAYEEALQQLIHANVIYRCYCNRKRLMTLTHGYDNYCRAHLNTNANNITQQTDHSSDNPPYAQRLVIDQSICFDDIFQGKLSFNQQQIGGDFILKRKDKLHAYQLACGYDDFCSNISHVIRGYDLINSTPRQLSVMNALITNTDITGSVPHYGHIPVLMNNDGKQKLSKQNFAPALSLTSALENLHTAAILLKQTPQNLEHYGHVQDLLKDLIANWQPNRLFLEKEVYVHSHQ